MNKNNFQKLLKNNELEILNNTLYFWWFDNENYNEKYRIVNYKIKNDNNKTYFNLKDKNSWEFIFNNLYSKIIKIDDKYNYFIIEQNDK